MQLQSLLNAEAVASDIAKTLDPQEVLSTLPDNRKIDVIPVNAPDWNKDRPAFLLLHPQSSQKASHPRNRSIAALVSVERTSRKPVNFSRYSDEWKKVGHHFSWHIVCTCCDSVTGVYGPLRSENPGIEELIDQACEENGIERLYLRFARPSLEDLQDQFAVELKDIEEHNPFWFVKM